MAKKDAEIINPSFEAEYSNILKDAIALFNQARHLSTRSVNAFMTASYWEFGRRIVEVEQNGKGRAEYGKQLLKRLAKDLSKELGRGFGEVNLSQMRKLYLTWGKDKIFQTASEKFNLVEIAKNFPLPWSYYVELLSCRDEAERKFYEDEGLRVGDEWFRVDLVLFNRRLKCLVIIDLKLGKFSHADVGQMILYTNYANEHWREEGENPPIGLILCDQKSDALAHYTLENLPNKILASEYKMVLPDEKILEKEIIKAKRLLEK